MPNVRGMFWDDVARQLQAVGWAGRLLKGPDVRGSAYAPGVIVTQDPGPGEHVAMSGMITLQFAGPD
ncbi:PASTA domain-containing protein [Mycolicibacterium cosmeticum]|uniref:PASTA domain-containing protein n=1 Tax=Mycolicibacterium cosmeticum TaxID=258533 RepID=UPI0032048A1A